ncbi:MAG: EAL domain-containing protein [Ilumatobacteraceae bacterium]
MRSPVEVLRANVAALRARGALIALDDFGTGTSNVRSLNELGADLVKLDRSLVAWGVEHPGQAVLEQAIRLASAAGRR